MSETLETLRKQHAHMRAVLQVLANAVADCDRTGRCDVYLADAALRYIAEFPRTLHRPVETALYEVMGRTDASVAATADGIVAEHPDLETRAERLREVLYWSGQHPELPRGLVASMTRTLIDDMHRHMSEEENTLFPAAEKILSASAWAQVTTKVAETGVMSESRKKPLRTLLAQIAALAPSPDTLQVR